MKPVTRLLLLMSLLSFLGCGHKTPAIGPEMDRNVHLQSLRISGTHGYHAYSNIGYRAERMDSGKTRVIVEVGDDRDRVFETDGALMDTLESFVREYRMDRYEGYYRPKMDILDGDSWSLELIFTDGSNTSCGGYMAYPPRRGSEAIGKTEGTLSRWLYQEPAEEVGLVSFRYELHCEEGTEIFTLQRKDSGCTVSVQPFGQSKATTYEGIDPYLATRLALEIRWNHMASYTGENPAEEDTSRPRWILFAEYENGQKIEAMDYLDRSTGDSWRLGVPSISEMGLRDSAERAFSDAIKP